MTTLHLARHGETVWHAENRYAGSSDIGLTDRGLAQAEALGRWAADARPVAVYSSDLSRAMITATPAASVLGLDLQIDARLREVHFGRGEGLTTAEMREQFPEALAEFHRKPGRSPLPGGEPGLNAVNRAWAALEQIAAHHEAGPVLVVMHSTLMRLVLCKVLDMPLNRYRSAFPSVVNAAITTISIGAGPTALLAYNSVDPCPAAPSCH